MKTSVVCMGVLLIIMEVFKEELTWVTDEWVWISSNIILFKIVIALRN